MTLRKISIDNIVKYIPQSDQLRISKPNTIKKNASPRKQNKNISQNNRKLLENVAAQGFGFLKRIMNCYF